MADYIGPYNIRALLLKEKILQNGAPDIMAQYCYGDTPQKQGPDGGFAEHEGPVVIQTKQQNRGL